jgi:hypothetical protein
MPRKFQLKHLGGSAGFQWKETSSPYGGLQFKDVTGDEYYAASKVYRIALVGRGSAIAYYLSALAPRTVCKDESDSIALHRSMVIFGKVDPWSKEVRGEGYINHEEHLIGHWGKTVAKYSADYMRRSAFAKQNSAAFKRAEELGATLADMEVYSIDKLGDLYQVFTKNNTSYFAAFVVAAMGLGPHRGVNSGKGAPMLDLENATVLDTTLMQDRLAPSVMDLDRFMREYPEIGGIEKNTTKRLVAAPRLKIAVQGANAGIDAVQRAWQLGHEIVWLCPNEPIFLKGNRLPIAREGVADVTRHMLARNTEVYVSPADHGKVRLRWTEGTGEKADTVDVFVIAVGQDPYAKGAVGDVLFKRGNIQEAALRMMWDFDQVFGLPFQTILGYQMPGHRRGFGLQIIGATCEVLNRALSPIFNEERLVEDFIEQLTPIGEEPTPKTSNEQIDASRSLTEKWSSKREAFHAERHKNWVRAIAQRDRFILLARAYISNVKTDRMTALLALLVHQVDPTAVPKTLSDILKKDFKNDTFLVSQLATAERPATSAGASALLPSQLSAVRAVVAALNAFIPEYILQGDANFTTDDRNMLAVYIAQNFQGFTPVEANARVSATMSLRRSGTSPLGFHDDKLRSTIQKRWGQEASRNKL